MSYESPNSFIEQETQNKLANARVMVAGMGTGSNIADELIRLGIGEEAGLILADNGILESRNLRRQRFLQRDAKKDEKPGRNKARAFATYAKTTLGRNYDNDLIIDEGVTEGNVESLVAQSSIIVEQLDVIDAFPQAIELYRVAKELGKPVVTVFDLGFGTFQKVFRFDQDSRTSSPSDKVSKEDIRLYYDIKGAEELGILPKGSLESFVFSKLPLQINPLAIPIEQLQEVIQRRPGDIIPQLSTTANQAAVLTALTVFKMIIGEPVKQEVAFNPFEAVSERTFVEKLRRYVLKTVLLAKTFKVLTERERETRSLLSEAMPAYKAQKLTIEWERGIDKRYLPDSCDERTESIKNAFMEADTFAVQREIPLGEYSAGIAVTLDDKVKRLQVTTEAYKEAGYLEDVQITEIGVSSEKLVGLESMEQFLILLQKSGQEERIAGYFKEGLVCKTTDGKDLYIDAHEWSCIPFVLAKSVEETHTNGKTESVNVRKVIASARLIPNSSHGLPGLVNMQPEFISKELGDFAANCHWEFSQLAKDRHDDDYNAVRHMLDTIIDFVTTTRTQNVFASIDSRVMKMLNGRLHTNLEKVAAPKFYLGSETTPVIAEAFLTLRHMRDEIKGHTPVLDYLNGLAMIATN